MPDPIPTYLPYLERHLTPRRVQHSLDVMHTMGRLADVYDLDREQALVTGLLHDAAKDVEPVRQVEIAKQAGIKIQHPCEWHHMYLHGPVGAHLVSSDLGITDPAILEAIKTHCAYSPDPHADTTLSWCLRFADLTEPGRSFLGVQKLRRMVLAGYLQEAALLMSAWLIEYFPKANIPTHPNFIHIRDHLSAQIGVDSDFFERR